MNKRKTGLKARIQGYMKEVTTDVFGYEKKVVDNVATYLESLSKSSGIPVSDLHIRIAQPQGKPEAHIYHQDRYYQSRHVRQATFNELANFFIAEGANVLFDMEAKINRGIYVCLAFYAEENKLPLHELDIRISKPAAGVMVAVCHRGGFVSNIPIKTLIKHFRG